MRISTEGLNNLIKRFESCRLDAYICPAGIPTIGWGATRGVKLGDKITQQQADDRLRNEVQEYEKSVDDALMTPPGAAQDPTQHQFDAMVSLCYNIGQGHFRSSSVVRRFLAGDIEGAADAFLMWNKGGGKALPELVTRRKAEKDWFLSKGETS